MPDRRDGASNVSLQSRSRMVAPRSGSPVEKTSAEQLFRARSPSSRPPGNMETVRKPGNSFSMPRDTVCSLARRRARLLILWFSLRDGLLHPQAGVAVPCRERWVHDRLPATDHPAARASRPPGPGRQKPSASLGDSPPGITSVSRAARSVPGMLRKYAVSPWRFPRPLATPRE